MPLFVQQSQLSHYPERKIAEFKLHIEELEREYKRFLNKLRALDPSYKHHPWTPRAYTKRRGDFPDAPDGTSHLIYVGVFTTVLVNLLTSTSEHIVIAFNNICFSILVCYETIKPGWLKCSVCGPHILKNLRCQGPMHCTSL